MVSASRLQLRVFGFAISTASASRRRLRIFGFAVALTSPLRLRGFRYAASASVFRLRDFGFERHHVRMSRHHERRHFRGRYHSCLCWRNVHAERRWPWCCRCSRRGRCVHCAGECVHDRRGARDAKMGGERIVQQWLQVMKKAKQFFCTKDAYRFRKELKLQIECASPQKSRTSHTRQHTPFVNGGRCAVRGARYTVCAARCTVYGVARELGLDRECGNADIGGTRMVEDCVQPFKNVKQVLYTKSAYRFWARP